MGGKGKGSPDIRRSLPRAQPNLGATRSPHQDILQGKIPEPGNRTGEDSCLIVPPGPPSPGRSRDRGHQRRLKSGDSGSRHLLPHELSNVPPTPVLESMDQSTGRGIHDHGGTGRSQDRRPILAFQTQLSRGLARSPGRLASGAEGSRGRVEAKPARCAYQLSLLFRRDPGTTGKTAPGQEMVQDLPNSRCGRHRPLASRRAWRMTSRDGSTPHHRWKATAAWWMSISTPSTPRIPSSRARERKAVSRCA